MESRSRLDFRSLSTWKTIAETEPMPCVTARHPLADLLSPKAKPTAATREGNAEMRTHAVGKGRVETPPFRPI